MKIEASFTCGPFIENLREGNVFWYENILYLKTAAIDYRYVTTHCGQSANAICLKTSIFTFIPEKSLIQIARVKIVDED